MNPQPPVAGEIQSLESLDPPASRLPLKPRPLAALPPAPVPAYRGSPKKPQNCCESNITPKPSWFCRWKSQGVSSRGRAGAESAPRHAPTHSEKPAAHQDLDLQVWGLGSSRAPVRGPHKVQGAGLHTAKGAGGGGGGELQST